MPDPHPAPPRNHPTSTAALNTTHASWHSNNPTPRYWPPAPPFFAPHQQPAPPFALHQQTPLSFAPHQQSQISFAQQNRPVPAPGPSFVPRYWAPNDAAGTTQVRPPRAEGMDTGEDEDEEDDDDTVVGEVSVEEPEEDEEDEGEEDEDGSYNRVRECCEGDDPGWCSRCRCRRCRKKQHLSGVALITEDIREEKEEQGCPMSAEQVEELRKSLGRHDTVAENGEIPSEIPPTGDS
ncbi:hypothetical protein NpNSSI1_00005000 [Neofusicoccum parvum]|nr:hypothetical protein NpNSSI1_00005000 [Neofusicoccum parvum]